jgi:hypothetical protein
MWKRVIRLQRETLPGVWEDIATCTPVDSGACAVARIHLPSPVSTDKIRVVNLLDLFEIEVR